jgi:hypothetical protein
MHVLHASLKFEPEYKVLGDGKYGLRSMMRTYSSFLGEQADFFPGFEPAAGEHVRALSTPSRTSPDDPNRPVHRTCPSSPRRWP